MSEFSPYFAELYRSAGARELGLSFDDFAAALRDASGRYLAGARGREVEAFHRGLHLEDLALARACALGIEPAWDRFLARYRAKLFEMAAAIARDESTGRELADSLYTDLFGTRQTADGRRISKLASYTGRGSLEGWLRTVLAQEYVNRYRSQRRTAEFDENMQPAAPAPEEPGIDPRLDAAVGDALAELSAEERLLMASYYLDGRTLAEIGRIEHVHESTVSRQIVRLTAELRKRIVRGLRRRGMSARGAEEALEADVRDLSVDVRATLLQERSAATFPERGQSG
jgi:RNA polymerase sigma-70 factor (ECF subfamily)